MQDAAGDWLFDNYGNDESDHTFWIGAKNMNPPFATPPVARWLTSGSEINEALWWKDWDEPNIIMMMVIV